MDFIKSKLNEIKIEYFFYPKKGKLTLVVL